MYYVEFKEEDKEGFYQIKIKKDESKLGIIRYTEYPSLDKIQEEQNFENISSAIKKTDISKINTDISKINTTLINK